MILYVCKLKSPQGTSPSLTLTLEELQEFRDHIENIDRVLEVGEFN